MSIDSKSLPADGVAVSIFFFQAEDGIRDLTVTGVQTCALPILGSLQSVGRGLGIRDLVFRQGQVTRTGLPQRSEERRVGKECRSRLWSYACRKIRRKVLLTPVRPSLSVLY